MGDMPERRGRDTDSYAPADLITRFSFQFEAGLCQKRIDCARSGLPPSPSGGLVSTSVLWILAPSVRLHQHDFLKFGAARRHSTFDGKPLLEIGTHVLPVFTDFVLVSLDRKNGSVRKL